MKNGKQRNNNRTRTTKNRTPPKQKRKQQKQLGLGRNWLVHLHFSIWFLFFLFVFYIFFLAFVFFHLFFVCILFFANFKILRASLGPAMLRVSHPRANLEETATLLWRLEAKHVEGAGGSQPGAGFIEGKGHSNLASTPCVRLPKREPSQRSRPSLMRPSKR